MATKRWSMIEQQAKRLAALGMSEREIAAELGVAKSTITRRKKKGDLPRIVVSNKDAPVKPVSERQSPAEWAAAIREEFKLDPSDDQLVTLGEQALIIAGDSGAKRSERLNASRTFMSIDAKLKLVIRAAKVAAALEQPTAAVVNGPTPAPVSRKPRATRRPTSDPRKGLMAVP